MSFFSQLDDIRDLRPRLRWALYIVIGAFSILFLRLWFLQVIRGDHFYEFSLSNTIKKVPILASRGKIFDRNGAVLADSRPTYKVLLNQQYVSNLRATNQVLADLLEIPIEEVTDQVDKAKYEPKFRPVLIKEHVNHKQLARVEASRLFYPSFETSAEPARFHPLEEATFHLLGFIGEITQGELKSLRNTFPDTYKKTDLIGKLGIEKAFDVQLKGVDGGEQVVVDAKGRRADDALAMRDLEDQKPIPGNDLVLTIDADLQKLAQDLFRAKDQAGSAVVMDVRTGAILAMYSAPSIDPHMFVRVISPDEWNAIQNNVKKPLIDKSLNGQFAPGSTWKIVVSSAALDLKKVNLKEQIFCPGHYTLGRRTYQCWKAAGHGWMNFHEALVQSCDVFFYEVGRRVGIDKIAEYARRYGFGSPTGFGLNDEKGGLVPSTEWKKRVKNEEWIEGETLSCAIGQGYDLVTPLQWARAMSALVNGGKLFRPWVVEKIMKPSGTVIQTFQGEQVGDLNLSADIRKEIMRGLIGVVQEPKGTAHWTMLPNIVHGGKTGTAQVVRLVENQRRLRVEEMAYMHRDHGWFVSFAPEENPEIAVIVLAEHGGHGATAAAPIARDLIAKYFAKKAQAIEVPQNLAVKESLEKNPKDEVKVSERPKTKNPHDSPPPVSHKTKEDVTSPSELPQQFEPKEEPDDDDGVEEQEDALPVTKPPA